MREADITVGSSVKGNATFPLSRKWPGVWQSKCYTGLNSGFVLAGAWLGGPREGTSLVSETGSNHMGRLPLYLRFDPVVFSPARALSAPASHVKYRMRLTE